MDLREVTSILAGHENPDAAGRVGAWWLHRDDGPGTWSAYDIVGHLLHSEATNWLPRIRTILRYGTERPFESFDREAMLGQDPEPTAVLVTRFRHARLASLDELSSMGLGPGDLDRRGLHPISARSHSGECWRRGWRAT
jgi:hypothetical protein